VRHDDDWDVAALTLALEAAMTGSTRVT
jgi:hypothetical protein